MKLSLLLLTALFAQPLLFSMEPSDIQPQGIEVKSKKKKNKPVDIKALCGYSASEKSSLEYLATLQKAANGFLIQDEFINQVQGYVKSEEYCQKIDKLSLFATEKSIVKGTKQPLVIKELSIETIESTVAFLRNRSLFVPLFSSLNPKKVSYEFASNNIVAQNNEDVQRFVENYKHSSNKEIKRMVRALQCNTAMKQATKVNEANVASLFRFVLAIDKSYNSIFVKQNATLSQFLVDLKHGMEHINQYTGNLLKESLCEDFNVLNDKNLDTYVGNLKSLAQKYQANKDKFNKYYEELYKEIQQGIDNERKTDNKNVKVLSYLKRFNVETGSFDRAVLPESLVQKHNADVSNTENQEWVPTSLQQVNAKPTKQKKKNKKQPFMPLQENKEEFEQEEVVAKVSKQEAQEFVDDHNKETEDCITIKDSAHNVVIKLFKSDTANQVTIPTVPSYTKWVNQWLSNTSIALDEQGYTDPENKKYTIDSERWKTKLVHGFSQHVDNYVQEWGKQTTTKSRRVEGKLDHLITVPGAIVYPDGSFETGLFSYIVDSANGEWYHRMFVTRSGKELVEDYMAKGYFDVEFPPLGGFSKE